MTADQSRRGRGHKYRNNRKGNESVHDRKVFISNLPRYKSPEKLSQLLYNHLSQYGKVCNVFIPVQHPVGNLGYGFATFSNSSAVLKILSSGKQIVAGYSFNLFLQAFQPSTQMQIQLTNWAVTKADKIREHRQTCPFGKLNTYCLEIILNLLDSWDERMLLERVCWCLLTAIRGRWAERASLTLNESFSTSLRPRCPTGLLDRHLCSVVQRFSCLTSLTVNLRMSDMKLGDLDGEFPFSGRIRQNQCLRLFQTIVENARHLSELVLACVPIRDAEVRRCENDFSRLPLRRLALLHVRLLTDYGMGLILRSVDKELKNLAIIGGDNKFKKAFRYVPHKLRCIAYRNRERNYQDKLLSYILQRCHALEEVHLNVKDLYLDPGVFGVNADVEDQEKVVLEALKVATISWPKLHTLSLSADTCHPALTTMLLDHVTNGLIHLVLSEIPLDQSHKESICRNNPRLKEVNLNRSNFTAEDKEGFGIQEFDFSSLTQLESLHLQCRVLRHAHNANSATRVLNLPSSLRTLDLNTASGIRDNEVLHWATILPLTDLNLSFLEFVKEDFLRIIDETRSDSLPVLKVTINGCPIRDVQSVTLTKGNITLNEEFCTFLWNYMIYYRSRTHEVSKPLFSRFLSGVLNNAVDDRYLMILADMFEAYSDYYIEERVPYESQDEYYSDNNSLPSDDEVEDLDSDISEP